MDKLLINGGKPLYGKVQIGGAKNAALPAMAAALLTDEEIQLENVPAVRDIKTMAKLLQDLGCEAVTEQLNESHRLKLDASHLCSTEAP